MFSRARVCVCACVRVYVFECLDLTSSTLDPSWLTHLLRNPILCVCVGGGGLKILDGKGILHDGATSEGGSPNGQAWPWRGQEVSWTIGGNVALTLVQRGADLRACDFARRMRARDLGTGAKHAKGSQPQDARETREGISTTGCARMMSGCARNTRRDLNHRMRAKHAKGSQPQDARA